MIELIRHFTGTTVATFIRAMTAAVGIGLLIFAYDPLVNPDAVAFDSPVFDVVERIAPLQTWGAWFLVAAALNIAAAVSGRFLVYIAATLVAAPAELSWFGAVVWARHFQDAPLTSGGIGLWVMSLSLTVGTLIYPRPLNAREVAPVQIETPDGRIVPIERIARRKADREMIAAAR